MVNKDDSNHTFSGGAVVANNNPRSYLSTAPHNLGRSIGGKPLPPFPPNPLFLPRRGWRALCFASVCSPPTPAASLRARNIGGTPLTALSPKPPFPPPTARTRNRATVLVVVLQGNTTAPKSRVTSCTPLSAGHNTAFCPFLALAVASLRARNIGGKPLPPFPPNPLFLPRRGWRALCFASVCSPPTPAAFHRRLLWGRAASPPHPSEPPFDIRGTGGILSMAVLNYVYNFCAQRNLKYYVHISSGGFPAILIFQ